MISFTDGQKIQISRWLQGSLFGFMAVGFIEGNFGILVNSLVGFLITFLPELLDREHGIVMSPLLTLWITSAVFFHALGTFGPYRSTWYWDHVAHTLSSSVVAAVGYSTLRAMDMHIEDVEIPSKFMFLFILAFVMAFGVLWEVIEFGIGLSSEILGAGRFLTQYGLEDTMMDLVFDLIGGIIVALFGTAYLTDFSDSLRGRIESF
jgi:hypothetical protein